VVKLIGELKLVVGGGQSGDHVRLVVSGGQISGQRWIKW